MAVKKCCALKQVPLLFHGIVAELVEEVRQLQDEVKTGQQETSQELARNG